MSEQAGRARARVVKGLSTAAAKAVVAQGEALTGRLRAADRRRANQGPVLGAKADLAAAVAMLAAPKKATLKVLEDVAARLAVSLVGGRVGWTVVGG